MNYGLLRGIFLVDKIIDTIIFFMAVQSIMIESYCLSDR